MQKELGKNEQNKKNLNQEIENIDKIITNLNKENEKLENRMSQTNSCIECLEQCKYDRILNITKEDLALKLKINYLIAQIHDKSETLRKLNEDRENTVYHRIVDPIQSFFNEIVFSDTESKEDFVNKLVSLVCNNKIKKNVTDKDLYNKFENDLRSTLKKFTKQNITKQDNIKKTDIKLDDQQSMNDQQFVEYLQAILDSLNNDEIPQMDKRANESSVTKLSKAVFNKLNTIPSSVIKNGAKILFTKYKDSSNDMEKNKDENNNSNKIQENNNAGNERNEELNKNTNEIKKDNKDNDSSDEEDIKL